MNKWKQSPTQANFLIQYNDQPVIKPEPNRMLYSQRSSPQISNPTSISTSVIRISPIGKRVINSNQNLSHSWTEQRNIVQPSSLQEQHAVILQNALTSLHNCTLPVNVPNILSANSPGPSTSPLNSSLLQKENKDESLNYTLPPSFNTIQSSVYSNRHLTETEFLVIKNNSNSALYNIDSSSSSPLKIDNLRDQCYQAQSPKHLQEQSPNLCDMHISPVIKDPVCQVK